jgi:hypothetical protein
MAVGTETETAISPELVPRLSLFVLGAAVVLRVTHGLTADFSFLLLACNALLGPVNAIRSLVFCWAFSMLNDGLFPEPSYDDVGRYGVAMAAALSMIFRSGIWSSPHMANRVVFYTILLGSLTLLHSALFSSFREISVLKSLAWTITASAIFSAWMGLGERQRKSASEILFRGLTLIAILSIPLLGSSVGYWLNGVGFQGILSHPQAFGCVMALLASWIVGRVLSGLKVSAFDHVLLVVSVALLYMSQTRTAAVALMLGVAVGVLIGPLITRQSFSKYVPCIRSKNAVAITGAILLSGIWAGSLVFNLVDAFIGKRGESNNLVVAYKMSRGGVIDEMLENIGEHPGTGIGFGVASTHEKIEVVRDPLFGLPVGASIEKGVLPLAVLEELGIVGFVFVTMWLGHLIYRAAEFGGIESLSVLLVTIIMNFGEYVIFSIGGMGMISLIVIGWSLKRRLEIEDCKAAS